MIKIIQSLKKNLLNMPRISRMNSNICIKHAANANLQKEGKERPCDQCSEKHPWNREEVKKFAHDLVIFSVILLFTRGIVHAST
jgi:hypothetical protein